MSSAPHIGIAWSNRSRSSSLPPSVAAGTSAGNTAQVSRPGRPKRSTDPAPTLRGSGRIQFVPQRVRLGHVLEFAIVGDEVFPEPREEGDSRSSPGASMIERVVRRPDENVRLELPLVGADQRITGLPTAQPRHVVRHLTVQVADAIRPAQPELGATMKDQRWQRSGPQAINSPRDNWWRARNSRRRRDHDRRVRPSVV